MTAKHTLVLFLLSIFVLVQGAGAGDFFEVKNIRILNKAGVGEPGVWRSKAPNTLPKDWEFVPCLEVELSVAQSFRANGTFVKAYFYDKDRKLITQTSQPSVARHGKPNEGLYALPVIFPEKTTRLAYFSLPQEIVARKDPWSVLVVFGDRHEAQARVYPQTSGTALGFEFSEKELITNPNRKKDRIPVTDPVIEHVVNTRNPAHPKITLFLRYPDSVSDGSEVKGVLAMCVLANSVASIKRQLQSENTQDYQSLFRYADQHQLAILCWGSQVLWRPDASYDELERATNKELDRSFDLVASAWERGVEELHKKYGLPVNNYLLWGMSSSAQWAHRLVLRKPDYFLAAYIHIPSSFDQPTPNAAKVLWLLTSGELDGGYQHGKRWYNDCRAAGYPIIYKAFMNLGHTGSPAADNLCIKFFDYARSIQDQRRELDKTWAETSKKTDAPPQPWLAAFRDPEYVADYLNQDVFPSSRAYLIPSTFRVPLPTKTLADAWNR